MEPTDRELVARVATGSTAALEELYRRHAPWLTARLARRCADRGTVDEALQDTFVAVWKGAARYQGEGDPGAWIWGIAVRRLVDLVRKRPPAAYEVLESDLGLVESAEDRVLVGVEHGDLGGALERLSPELRSVVQATVLDGLTTKEAAALLGLRQGTVKTRMMRARQVLRKELA